MSSSFLDEFSIEAKELLDEMEEGLLDIEGGGDWQENYNKVYRAMHSLKGASGMMGLDDLQGHMHRVEDQFESMKSNQEKLKTYIDFFLDAVDHGRNILKGEVSDFEYLDEGVSDDTINEESAEENTISPKNYENAVELLDKAYHLLIYQFVDLDRYLKEKNKEQVRVTLKREISEIAKEIEKLKESST